MGLFSRKKKEEAGKDYCLFCGMDLVNGVCSSCGREAKPMVGFDAFQFKPVPVSVAEQMGEQKKKLFGNDKLTVQEMIRDGNLYIADILFDSTVEDEREVGTGDDTRTEYDYYVQFSTPDGAPCKKCCEILFNGCCTVEDRMKEGRREGWLLKGVRKKKEYYYAFVPEDESLAKMLRIEVAEFLMTLGACYEDRRLAPKGALHSYEIRGTIRSSWNEVS